MPLRFFYTASRRQDQDGQHLYLEVPDAYGPGIPFMLQSTHANAEQIQRALETAIDECRSMLKSRWGEDVTLEPAPAGD